MDSIKPILEQIDAELILTDTGCGKEVRSIIEEYTDNILEFEWCRDFSKARNLGLKHAKGEWFLYLDDDEWFEDVSDIVTFFNCDEYRNYGMATYYQRNYEDEQGLGYEDLAVTRIVKLEPDVKFQYRIHECFNRVPGKTKVLNSYVHHYGYVYKSEKEKEAHSERNIRLLLKEHEKEPYNLRHILQLVQEYNVMGRYGDSIEIALKGIEYDTRTVTQLYCRNSLLVNVINCYIEKGRYEELVEIGSRYIEQEKLDELSKAIIYFRMAASYFEVKQYEKATDALLEYWKRYQFNKENPEMYIAYNTSVTAVAFQLRYVNVAICLAVRIYMAREEYQKAKEWILKLNIEEPNLILTDKMINEIVHNYYIEQGESKTLLLSMCNYLLKRKDAEYYIVELIEKKCFEEKENNKEKILLHFYELKGRTPFFQMIQFLCKLKEQEDIVDLTEELKLLCKSDMNRCFRYFIVYEVWNKAKEKGIDLEDVILSISYSSWDKAITSYCKYQLISEMEGLQKLFSSVLNSDDLHMLSWLKSYYFYKLQQQANEIKKINESNASKVLQDDKIEKIDTSNISWIMRIKEKTEELLEALKVYGDICLELYSRIYRPEILSVDIGMLPKEGQAGFYIANWIEYRECQKLMHAVKVLKEAKKVIPEWGAIFQICLKVIEEDNKEQQSVQNEFYVLGNQLKRKAKECILLGQLELAKNILSQLKAMLPEDMEIDSLLEEIM